MPEESTNWEGGPHPISLLGSLLTAIVIMVGTLILFGTELVVTINGEDRVYSIVPALLGLAVILTLGVAWKYISLKMIKYIVTDEQIHVIGGVLNRRTDDLELYRVKDLIWEEPLLLRLVGAGNLTLITSDKSNMRVILMAIKGGGELKDSIRARVEELRDAKGVRELDIQN